jgi:hypothetical protein
MSIDGEAERNRVHLAAKISLELSDFTEKEQLTTKLIAFARKNENE